MSHKNKIDYIDLDFSLSDIPGKPSTVLYLWGCNFLCLYCHNKICFNPIARREIEVPILIEKVLGNRLSNAISITGGEPLLQTPALVEFIHQMKEKRPDYYISVDTNGSFPEKVEEIAPLVNRIAIDFKNSPDLYENSTNTKIDPKKVLESISIANRVPGLTVEVRTVFVRPIVTYESLEKIIDILKEMSFQGTYIISQYLPSEGVGTQYKDLLFTEPATHLKEFLAKNSNAPFRILLRNL